MNGNGGGGAPGGKVIPGGGRKKFPNPGSKVDAMGGEDADGEFIEPSEE